MKEKIFSVFKGIGIITVVIGHSGCPGLLHDFIYLFHMALFYFVSGYFFKDKHLCYKFQFVIKRLRRLYVPWVLYGVIFVLAHNLFVNIGIYASSYEGYNMMPYTTQEILSRIISVLAMRWQELLLSPLWFLKSLLVSNIIFLFLLWECKKLKFSPRREIQTFAVIYIIAGIVSQFIESLPMNLGREFMAVGIMYIGYQAHKNIKKIKFSRGYAILAFCVLLCCTQIGHVEFSCAKITNILFFTVCTVCGIYLVYYISSWLSKFNKVSVVLSFIGNHTLEIFCLHCLAFKIVTALVSDQLEAFPVVKDHYLWPFYTLVGITLPLLSGYSYTLLKQMLNIRKRRQL